MLTFSSHPPSTGCSDVLPSTVCEGRGGEKRFAMNQRTQLQFNLGVAPNHTKLATSFGPSHPSPVTIHKPAAETIGISCTPIQDFKAVSPNKLALAMKLAKRNVNSVPDLRVYDVESEETDESFEEVELKQNHLRKDVRCQNVRGYAPSEAIGRELGELQLELDRSIERMHRSKGKGKRAAVRAVDRLNARVVGGVGGGRPAVGVVDRANTKSVGGGRPAVGVADRARAAGKAGARVVGTGGHALRMTDRPSARIAGWVGARGDVKVVNDRICWVDLDENQEREQQRREEQVTRNTRMMYDLSQQVRVQSPSPSFSLLKFSLSYIGKGFAEADRQEEASEYTGVCGQKLTVYRRNINSLCLVYDCAEACRSPESCSAYTTGFQSLWASRYPNSS